MVVGVWWGWSAGAGRRVSTTAALMERDRRTASVRRAASVDVCASLQRRPRARRWAQAALCRRHLVLVPTRRVTHTH